MARPVTLFTGQWADLPLETPIPGLPAMRLSTGGNIVSGAAYDAINADMVEIDVTLTADGQIVVIHDETLDRTTDGSGRVSDFTRAELQQLDAGGWFAPRFAGERIPSLDAVLDETEDRILLNVEINSEAVDRGIVAKVASAIRRQGMIDQVVVSSFSPKGLQEMNSAAPEIWTAVLYNTEFHTDRDPVEIVTHLGASVFNIKRQRLTKKMRRRCRENNIPIGVYTVNEPRRSARVPSSTIVHRLDATCSPMRPA